MAFIIEFVNVENLKSASGIFTVEKSGVEPAKEKF